MNRQSPIYQVSELVSEMRKLMETSYPEIWIEGELSSLSKPASGHFYFSLKDEQSQLRCAMFRNRATISRYQPRSGDLVRVRAKISVYTARGDLQCIVQHIEEAGEGILQRRYEELKAKLHNAGLFATQHKIEIPRLPKRIGLITSPSGAAIRDVLTTLKRRNPGIPITIYPAVVQGEAAAQSLITALSNAVQHNQCDVLVLTRGGGSMEDLWCFNDEGLAHEIFNCPIPIISAVGHEVDTTIADFVADVRAPTPTAAAELLSPEQIQMQIQSAALGRRLRDSWQRYLQKQAQRVDFKYAQLKHPASALKLQRKNLQQQYHRLQQSSTETLKRARQQHSYIGARFLNKTPQTSIAQLGNELSRASEQLVRSHRRIMENKFRCLHEQSEQLDLVSPLAVLGRGYSITRDKNSAVVRRHDEVKVGQEIQVQLSSGHLDCEVSSIHEAEKK